MAVHSEESRMSSWASWLTSPFVAVQGAPETVSTEISPEQPSGQEIAEPATDQTPDLSEDGAGEQSSEALPMAGTWQKDESTSDAESYAQQIAMLHMSSLYTYAALHYMWGVEITVNDQGHLSITPSLEHVSPFHEFLRRHTAFKPVTCSCL